MREKVMSNKIVWQTVIRSPDGKALDTAAAADAFAKLPGGSEAAAGFFRWLEDYLVRKAKGKAA